MSSRDRFASARESIRQVAAEDKNGGHLVDSNRPGAFGSADQEFPEQVAVLAPLL